MDLKDYFILFFFAIAIVLFFWGIFRAIYWSNKADPGQMPPFLRQVVTAIGGVLAANVGVVLGIKVEQALFQDINLITNIFKIPQDTTVLLQLIAAILYAIGMLVALIAWGRLKFSEDPDKVVSVLPQLSQTLLGILVGAVAIVIGA